MKWLGDDPFHTLLVLTERPGQWAPWKLLPVPLALAACCGWAWANVTGDLVFGWSVALGQLLFALLDWCLFALLPRRSISFGAVQPPWLALLFLRSLLTLIAVLVAAHWVVLSVIAIACLQSFILAMMTYGMLVEPFRVKVSHVEIPNNAVPTPVHIVQLSDLHVERLTRRDRALPIQVKNLDPDLIVLTGDFLSTSYNSDPRAMADLSKLLAQFRAPAGLFAIWGTPEVDIPHLLRPTLIDLGINVLEDRAVDLDIRGTRLWLMGLTCTRSLDDADARLGELLADAPPNALTVLLYHTPDLFPRASARGVDLVLSGHTHGGQWRLPGFGAILTSSCYWKRYEAGHYRESSSHMYVSRGLGMEGFGAPRARFFCPPEVVSIRLTGLGQ